MPDLKLKTVTRTQGNNRALKDGTVKPKTFEFAFEEVDPLIAAFRRMVRGNEFDICEMAITTYICAKAHGKPHDRRAGLPGARVPPRRHAGEHQGRHPHAQGSRGPKGRRQPRLHGHDRRVGAQHPAGGARRRSRQDHLGALRRRACGRVSRRPSNVVPIAQGKQMGDMLASGELAAAIGVEVDAPDVKPLIPDALEAGLAALRRNGHYPINHTVVIKDELIAKHPDLAARRLQRLCRIEAPLLSSASRSGRSRSRPRWTRCTGG